jgi:hypothetical protein
MKILNIVNRPAVLEFRKCVHKPTVQEFAILPCGGTCETQHGSMSFRAGDYLISGVNGQLYVLTPDSFEAAYRVPPAAHGCDF